MIGLIMTPPDLHNLIFCHVTYVEDTLLSALVMSIGIGYKSWVEELLNTVWIDFQQIHGSASQVQHFGPNPNRPIENQHVYIYLCRGEKGPKEKLKKAQM